MILSKKALTLAEVKEYRKDVQEPKAVDEYLDKFASKANVEKSNKIKESLKSLNNPKIKDEHIVKVIDLQPEDAEDVNKIFNDVSLTEEEANVIIEILRK